MRVIRLVAPLVMVTDRKSVMAAAFLSNIVACAKAMNDSLPNTVVIQFADWSGPWGSPMATNRIPELFSRLTSAGIGVGTPNVYPDTYETNGYAIRTFVLPELRKNAGKVVLGSACQGRTFETVSPAQMSAYVQDVFDAARKGTPDSLNLNYMFWTLWPNHIAQVKDVLNKAGAPWAVQKHRGLANVPPLSVQPTAE